MTPFSSGRSRARLTLAGFAATLAAAALIGWFRAELTVLAVKQLMAGGPVAELRYSGLELGVAGAELAGLAFHVDTPAGRLRVEADGINAGYELGAAELTTVTVRHARLGFDYQPVETPSVDGDARSGPIPLPLQRLRVDALEFAMETPWGDSRFHGEGDLTRRNDGTVTLVIQDAAQSIRAEFPADFTAATVAIEGLPQRPVMGTSIRGLNRPERRIEVQADAAPLLGWLADSPLVPSRLRKLLEEWGVDRIAPGIEGLALAIAAESADGFHSSRGTGALRRGERSLLQAEIGMTGAEADVHGRLNLPAAEALDVMRPLLPRVVSSWRVSGGAVTGEAAWHRNPAGTVTTHGSLAASGLTLDAGAVRLEAAELVLHLTDLLAPTATASLTAPRVQLGSAVAAGGLAIEASLTGGAVSLGRATLSMFGGAVDLEPAVVELGPDPVALTLRLRELDLAQLLAALSQPGLSGTGNVSGALPLRLSAEMVELDDGRLIGSGPGVFRYQGPAADDSLAFRALRNFAYRRLQARVHYRPNGDYGLGIRLEGHNPDVLSGHPIAFNLKLTGRLPELLQQGILAGDFERPVLERYENANPAPKPGQGPAQRKPPPADRRDR